MMHNQTSRGPHVQLTLLSETRKLGMICTSRSSLILSFSKNLLSTSHGLSTEDMTCVKRVTIFVHVEHIFYGERCALIKYCHILKYTCGSDEGHKVIELETAQFRDLTETGMEGSPGVRK